MNLERIQAHIDDNVIFEYQGGYGTEGWIEVLRIHFEASSIAAKKADKTSVPFILNLAWESARIWLEWMINVKEYVVFSTGYRDRANNVVFTRMTKERIPLEKYKTFQGFAFFPKGTTKEMIERLYSNVHSVEW